MSALKTVHFLSTLIHFLLPYHPVLNMIRESLGKHYKSKLKPPLFVAISRFLPNGKDFWNIFSVSKAFYIRLSNSLIIHKANTMENHSHDRVCNLARDSSWFAYDFNLDFLRKIIFYLEVFSEICFTYSWTFISNIQYSHPISYRSPTHIVYIAREPNTDVSRLESSNQKNPSP